MATDRIPAPTLDSKPAVSRGARACTVCRAAKMKCVGAEDDGAKPCQRCRRSNLECIFEKHRRGRKPGSKLSEASKMLRKLEKGVSNQKAKAHESQDLTPAQIPFPVSDSRSAPRDPTYHPRYSPREVYVPSHGPRHSPDDPYPSAPTLPAPPPPSNAFSSLTAPFQLSQSRYVLPQPQQPRHQHQHHQPAPSGSSEHSIDEDEEDDKDGEDTMYPVKILEREGRRQSFFGTVLTNPSDSTKHPPKPSSPSHPPPAPARLPRHEASPMPRPPHIIFDDPVSEGIIAESELTALFEMVFVRLNTFINLFDPALHTPAYVRSRCPFLFTTLIMVGCKFWKPDRFRACQRLAENYCIRAFQESWKRVEVVQAFMCMTYWKEPDDNRTWTYIGYACRMAVELGLNAYAPISPVGESQSLRLERRNRERTYLVLFVHDRSLAMQTGRQWMLPEDDLVRHSEHWLKDNSLLPIDAVIVAQVQLRRIAAEVTDVFYLQKGLRGPSPADVNYEILLRGCNSKLQMWDDQWIDAIRRANGERFHFALLQFFKLHVRLFLNSLGLQPSLVMTRSMHSGSTGSVNSTGMDMSSHMPSLSALSACYTSAVDTLKIVSNDFATVEMLRYAQDSINVMTAYSAVLLLMLLRNTIAGRELGEGAQKHVNDLIIAAADAYQDASKSMSSSSSLEYHARFLRTLVAKERAMKQRQAERERKAIDGLSQPQQQQQQCNGTVHSAGAAAAATSSAAQHEVSPTSATDSVSLARLTPPNSAAPVTSGYPRTNGTMTGATAEDGVPNGNGSSDGGPGRPGRPAVGTSSGPYQPRPTQPTQTAGQNSYQYTQAWHIPASSQFHDHPLVSSGNEVMPELQAGMNPANGGGGSDGGAYALAQLAAQDVDLEPNQKMDVLYWYHMYSEIGLGRVVTPTPTAYMNDTYRMLEQPQQQPQQSQQQQQQQTQLSQPYGAQNGSLATG